jgi:hypothetical protein
LRHTMSHACSRASLQPRTAAWAWACASAAPSSRHMGDALRRTMGPRMGLHPAGPQHDRVSLRLFIPRFEPGNHTYDWSQVPLRSTLDRKLADA